MMHTRPISVLRLLIELSGHPRRRRRYQADKGAIEGTLRASEDVSFPPYCTSSFH